MDIAPDELHELAEHDPVGVETLRRMESVDRYNRWIHREFAPYIGSRILEVGCGIGNMSEFLRDAPSVVALDRLQSSCEFCSHKFNSAPNIQVRHGDITHRQTVEELGPGSFDTVMCINVLEHIRDDLLALRHMHELLSAGGKLLLFVPAGQFMFGQLDIALGHYRRYDRTSLAKLIEEAGFSVERLEYLNLAGIPGWWLNSKVLRREILPQGQLKLFNVLAPLFIGIERVMRRVVSLPVGQSLLCVAARER